MSQLWTNCQANQFSDRVSVASSQANDSIRFEKDAIIAMPAPRSKTKSSTAKKPKKPPPKPNGNILNYFSKVPLTDKADATDQTSNGNDASANTSPVSFKRKWDGITDEAEARRTILTKALEARFGADETDEDEDEDDELRSLFEEDPEDVNESLVQQEDELTAIVEGEPQNVDEKPVADCFMCGKPLGELDEAVRSLFYVLLFDP